MLDPNKLPSPPQKLVEKILVYLTLLTNLFICSGVIRHWNNMPHQSSKMKAHRVSFEPEPEKKQPEDFKEEPEYKEPEGEPSY
jgi:hypothetical protein